MTVYKGDQVVANGIVVDEGTTDYTELENKPQINGVELSGNKTLEELGIQETLTPGTGIAITDGTISSTVTTPDASTTIKGISRYATDEETIAHTVTTAAITPSNLADLYATKENTANKVTTITDDATDTQYPSAAAVNSRIMHIMNNSTDFVRTVGNQTIGDTKIFTGSFYKKVNLDITQNPEEDIYTDNKIITNQDDSALSYTALRLTTNNELRSSFSIRRKVGDNYPFVGITNSIDSEGNQFIEAYPAHDKNDPLYRNDSVITAGDLVNATKDFNIVHKTGDETIYNTKTFTSTVERTATLSGAETRLIRLKDNNNSGEMSFCAYYTNNETYARILNKNTTVDKYGYLDVTVSDDGKFSVRPNGNAEYDFESANTLQRRQDVTSLVNSRITNCITEIPQDIKLELNNGTLTLKAGSKVYVPNGVGVFDTVTIESDIILSSIDGTSSTVQCVLLYYPADNKLKPYNIDSTESGDTRTKSPSTFYNTSTNIIQRYDANNLTISGLSFPLAIITGDQNSIASIDQVFNGLGFIGSAAFTLPGLEVLLPNGLNDDGTLNNIKLTTSKVQIRNDTNYYITMNPNGAIGAGNDFVIKDHYTEDFTGYLYNKSTNLMYAFDARPEPAPRCILAELTFSDNNRIASLKPRTICNIPTFNDVVTKDEYLTENEIQRQIFNRIYDGRDLTKVFAKEIQYYSDEWAWIKARIQKADYSGLYVGDYIPVTMNAGTVGDQSIAQQTFQCQIAGIDTYTNCGDTAIGHHIDFISREVINTEITWNPENNNNGTANEVNPWLSSQVYAWLNGINNYTTSAYNNVPHGGDYSAGGILQLLPTKLTNLIITKRNLLDSRYDATKLLTYSTTWIWKDMGKLWLPNEIEVYGTQIRSNLGYNQGYWNPEANIAVAYPIYLGSGRNRIKRISSGGRASWWLSSVVAHSASICCLCDGNGNADSHVATHAGLRAPLCFRIA